MATVLAPTTLKLDLVLKQAATATIHLTVVDAVGNAITDPTGYTIRAQIRRTTTGPVLYEWNTTPNPGQGTATLIYSAGTDTSTATLSLTDEDSALFNFRVAQWDVYLANPVGQATCLAEGAVRIDPAITHA